MKRKIRILLVALMCYIVPITTITTTQVGCSTTQKRVAYNSVYSIAISVDSSMKAFAELYVKGEVSKDTWEKVKSYHARYQEVLKLSVEALKYDLSKEAGTDLIKAASDLMAIIKRK